MSQELPEIIITREGFIAMQICTTIPPEKKDTINERLRYHGLHFSGTTNGWHLHTDTESVRCEDFPDRFHYICTC